MAEIVACHKSYEAFESRMSMFENIQDELSNPEVHMIGIYGASGIGKTMLARNVAAHAEDNKLFDLVAFAEVSMRPDTKEIQQEIAIKVGLLLGDQDSASRRAKKLQLRLMQLEKVLLILDNIWEALSLEEVGIPIGNDHKGCKVLLTARSSDVLLEMTSQRNFKIHFLDEGEAWSLFKKNVGACIEDDDCMQALAMEVARACGGLPIAITSVAVALKGKGVSVWKEALKELKRPSKGSFEGVAAETYSCIEISYNQLKGKELKSIFLLCSIMRFTTIEHLLAYGFGLGLFKGIQTIEEARGRVNSLVEQLKDSSLLLDANNQGSMYDSERANSKRFSVHDVVRDVARSIASRDGHMIIETSSVVSRELLGMDALKHCNKISLHATQELPKVSNCPQLEFFYMKTMKELLKVPKKFFIMMPKLKVLHLVGLDLDPASNSLGCLVNLQTLRIDSCFIHDFHFLGEMKQLKFLSIRSDDLQELPKEICTLTGLRLLDLNYCNNLRDIPPNVLATLIMLEELYLFNWRSNIKWEVEGFKILDELKYLSLLTTLEINIPDCSPLPKGNLLLKRLERYKINIGKKFWIDPFCLSEASKVVSLNLGNSGRSDDIPHIMPSVKKFLSALSRDGFLELEVLCVEESSCFRTIVDCLKSESCDPFPFLKSLILGPLSNLEKIYNLQLKAESFFQLRDICVYSCNNLKNVFSFSTNRVLPLLQVVTVGHCDNMEEIFAMQGRKT